MTIVLPELVDGDLRLRPPTEADVDAIADACQAPDAAATNPRSHAVARRLGFVHEGTLRQAAIDGPTGDRQAPRCDVLVWGLLPGELR